MQNWASVSQNESGQRRQPQYLCKPWKLLKERRYFYKTVCMTCHLLQKCLPVCKLALSFSSLWWWLKVRVTEWFELEGISKDTWFCKVTDCCLPGAACWSCPSGEEGEAQYTGQEQSKEETSQRNVPFPGRCGGCFCQRDSCYHCTQTTGHGISLNQTPGMNGIVEE